MSQLLSSPEFLLNLIIWLCSSALVISIIADFMFYGENKNTKNELKSKVATGNMSLFFFVLYLILLLRLWKFPIENLDYKRIITGLGLFLVVVWTIFNIAWRYFLAHNWANHIKIYDNHTLVTAWPYKIVRHPLYSSLIWLSYGVWLAYCNWLILILTSIVFLPMMFYRAKQEEKMLTERFSDYVRYKQKVWMFFPKIF